MKKKFFLFLLVLISSQTLFVLAQENLSSEQFCSKNFFYTKKTPPNSNVVSVSAFRPKKITNHTKFMTYIYGMEKGARDLPNKLPGWIYRIYTDRSLSSSNDMLSLEFQRILLYIIKIGINTILYKKNY